MKRSLLLLLLIPLITSSAFATDKDLSKNTNAERLTTNIVQKALCMPATRIETNDYNQFVYSSTTNKTNHNKDSIYADASIMEHLKAFLSIKENADSVQRFIDTHRLKNKDKIAVRNKIKTIKTPNNIVSRFNSLFSSWEYFINTEARIAYSNDLEDRKESEYYSQLLQMGKDILPLVVEKMLDKKYFYSIILYDDLQGNDPKLCYRLQDRTIVEVLAGEQTRVARTILKWYHNASESK